MSTSPPPDPELNLCLRAHLRLGWWSLVVFLTLGLVLEALHGFKVGWYLNVSSETRRLMLTLAHAHGTLLSLINIGFAFTLSRLPAWTGKSRRTASVSLRAATLLLPGGFLLGGLFLHRNDPGLGILLVPVGGVLLLIGAVLVARAVSRSGERSAAEVKIG